MKESTIQMQIVEYLSLIAQRNNFLFFSVPNEGAIISAAGRNNHALSTNLKKMGLLPGVSDIVIIYNGKAYFIEVKREDGKQSENQKIFERRVTMLHGCQYEIVRSVQAVENALWKWGVIE